jgi:hypothetical protein
MPLWVGFSEERVELRDSGMGAGGGMAAGGGAASGAAAAEAEAEALSPSSSDGAAAGMGIFGTGRFSGDEALATEPLPG